MEKFAIGLTAEMNLDLQKIALESENNYQKAEGSYYVVEAALQKLKQFVLEFEFKDSIQEIRFFKEIKPSFLKELIYYIEVYHIEAHKPMGNPDSLKHYYRSELNRVALEFERNQFLYNYYRSGRTNYDHVFFLRNADNKILSPEYTLETDPRFSSVYSFNLSKLMAFEQLDNYLNHSLFLLDNPLPMQVAGEGRRFTNVWTESKAALIELTYALHARGAVNNGRGEVKQIIADFEVLFNVQLGNFYRVYQGMRIRKKNRTAFLDTLKESLERRMDDADMNV